MPNDPVASSVADPTIVCLCDDETKGGWKRRCGQPAASNSPRTLTMKAPLWVHEDASVLMWIRPARDRVERRIEIRRQHEVGDLAVRPGHLDNAVIVQLGDRFAEIARGRVGEPLPKI